MLETTENQTIALAGIFQAIHCVNELAYHGRCNQDAFDSSIQSTVNINTNSIFDIFSHPHGVKTGLNILRDQLDSKLNKRDPELSRYAITVVHLESRLRSNDAIFNTLREGISRIESQIELNGMSDMIIANMAQVYQDSISQLTPRIMVNGDSNYLSNDHIASKVRAGLLSAMRSAVLWRQCGGSRLKLLFKRNTYLTEVNQLLEGNS